MENVLEEYWLSMKKAIIGSSSLENTFEPATLQEEHTKQVNILTEESSAKEELEDTKELLNSHLLNFVEHEEEKAWQDTTRYDDTDSDANNNNYVCFYITYFWLFITTCRNKPEINLHPTPEDPRFDAQVGRSKTGKLVSGHNFHELSDADKLKVENYELLLDHVRDAAVNGSRVSKEITLDLIKGVKKFVDGKNSATKNKSTQQIMLVLPSGLAFDERRLLRDCCKTAGFKRIVMLTDSSLATYRLFSTLPPRHKVTVLVVNIFGDYQIRMEIFGSDKNGREISTVKLLAVASQEWNSDKRIFTVLYKRTLAQLSKQRQDSMWYYTVLSEYSGLADICLEQFLRFEEHLRKIHAVRDHTLLETVQNISRSSAKLRNFLDVMATEPVSVPEEAEEEETEEGAPENYRKENIRNDSFSLKMSGPPPVSAKLPLKIDTQDGKIYCIPACTDWTVRSLKECFKDLLGRHNHGPFLLQYGTQKLHNDNDYLSAYNIQPDSIVQANFYLVVKKSAVSIKKTENDEPDSIRVPRKNVIQLIGYCIARKYGMEPAHVEGMKRGSSVIARNTTNNATSAGSIGEVKKTCKINGLRGTFVKVAFKSLQLHLRSSGIKIEHVNSTGGNCIKCDKIGKVELCIPCKLIGSSSRDLFYIQ